ncbi:MAG: DUF86 domain-containing protein [Phormidesmis sp.]
MKQDNHALIDILRAAQRIEEYTVDTTLVDFYEDVQLQDKVMRRLLSIGKNAQWVSDVTRDEMSAIAWSELSSLKKWLLQDDPFVNVDQVWSIVQTEIPILIQVLDQLVAAKEKKQLEKKQPSLVGAAS